MDMKRYTILACLLMCAGMKCSTAWAQGESLATRLHYYIEDSERGFLVAARLVEATGLSRELNKVRDEEYERMYQQGQISDLIDMSFAGFSEMGTAYAPEHRRYGFTLFAETDNFWESELGKTYTDITPADVRDYIVAQGLYPEATTGDDFASPDNALYQFVSYHLLPMRVAKDKLVLHVNEYGYSSKTPDRLGIPVMEYYTTMGPRRLLKTYQSRASDGICLNRFPSIDNSRHGTGDEISCDPDKQGVRVDVEAAVTDIINGIIYPISGLLAFDPLTRDRLGRERIRFDVTSLLPEFMSNDIRKRPTTEARHQNVYIPPTSTYPYLDALTMIDETYCVYENAYGYEWCNLQADEFQIAGRYDVTLRLPPVPVDGTYELRYKLLATGSRSICQIYFGTDRENLKPTGMPLDLTQGFNSAAGQQYYGWQNDTDDEISDAFTDLRLRQHNVMKGAKAIATRTGTERDKNNYQALRHILLRREMKAGETYYVRFRSVMDVSRTLYMDYFELCPRSVYDNPYQPEDIW